MTADGDDPKELAKSSTVCIHHMYLKPKIKIHSPSENCADFSVFRDWDRKLPITATDNQAILNKKRETLRGEPGLNVSRASVMMGQRGHSSVAGLKAHM